MKRPVLHKGDTVMIVSPSWHKGDARTYPMENFLNAHGFEVETHPQCALKWGQVAGTVAERVTAIHEAFLDDSIQGIFCAAGGYGALQLLSQLDYELIRQNPKVFVGYSDITALLAAFYQKAGLVTYHGPMGCFMTDKENEPTTQSMWQMLLAESGTIHLKGDVLQKGESKGVLLGGNMTVFDQLIGTEYMPMADDVILFLEDTTDEKINELDKKLLHLKHAGYLSHVRGVILGEMDKLADNAEPFGFKTKDILARYLPNIPAVMNVKCGHEETLLTFPYGSKVMLQTGEENSLIMI